MNLEDMEKFIKSLFTKPNPDKLENTNLKKQNPNKSQYSNAKQTI